MSSQSFRKKTKVVLTNMDLKFLQSTESTYRNHSSTHLNTPDCCKLCGGERSFDIQTQRREPLVGHHVKYFPPVIAFVHYSCHKKIHDVKNPLTEFIQYQKGDSEKYYNLKKNNKQSQKLEKTNWSMCS